ncbi:type IV conjugative transfer system protein TraL [Novosphingobium percolationis]|jgi:conjugal transfer pilus assembly protein TraL|uniref:type IV conjugative transfer system protein TraL n=1 Tax=Novosphingobium percolationis TaxID=2871811 RepID=UPI001CD45010|nr:type IV conjugative transfer system protein TraL [Novosphingobium percolationis]
MSDRYTIPRRLDDPELIGFWTIDEFAGMVGPFTWGILAQHILVGIALSGILWFALRKAKAGRASSWVRHAAYWYLPAGLSGLKATPPSCCRLLVG